MCITQYNLALDLGTSKSLISQYERGETTPSFAKIFNLATILKTTPEYLQYGIVNGNGDEQAARINLLISSLKNENNKDYVFSMEKNGSMDFRKRRLAEL